MFFGQRSFCQPDTIFVAGAKFVTIKKAIATNYDLKDTLLNIYRLESGKRKFMLSHYLFQYGLDCNNEYRSIGSVEIKDGRLILRTKYLQKGFDPIPKKRIRSYRVNGKGQLIFISDKTEY